MRLAALAARMNVPLGAKRVTSHRLHCTISLGVFAAMHNSVSCGIAVGKDRLPVEARFSLETKRTEDQPRAPSSVRRTPCDPSSKVDVDFSLALHNRTGKFFIGRDLLADQADLIGRTYYGRFAARTPPVGLKAKVLSRFWTIEDRLRKRGVPLPLRRFRTDRRLLHLDPFTVLNCALRADDIVLCHDLGPLTHRDLFTPSVCDLYDRAYATMAGVDPTVVFVSEASREAYRSVVGTPRRSHVVYPPVRLDIADDAPVPVAGVGQPFLLTVGSIGRRKNQLRSISAYARSGLADRGIGYVLCGAREPGAEEIETIASKTPGVRLLSYVTDGELAWLYAHATGFVLASRLEGFGMPVAEAIARQVVPLVTRGSVLEEVAGPAALLTSADDENEIAAGMRQLVNMDSGERWQRQTRLTTWASRFSERQFREGWRDVLRN